MWPRPRPQRDWVPVALSNNKLNNVVPFPPCLTFCLPTDSLWDHPPNKLFTLNCLSQHLLLGEPNPRHTLWKSFTYSYKHSVNLNWTFFSSWCFIFEVNWGEDGFYNLKMVFTKGVLNLYPWIVTSWDRCFAAWNGCDQCYLKLWENIQISNVYTLSGFDKSKL